MFKVRERAWSPYVAGIILGLLLLPAMVVSDMVLDPSAGILATWGFLQGRAQGSGAWWQLALLAGMPLGARLSATLSGSRRRAPSPAWTSVLGSSSLRRRVSTGFAGGFLMMLGAGLAGGCMAGHGLSGVAQLAVGSIIAFLAMVAGGLMVGQLLGRP